MANSDKDILITPNTGSSTDDPKIEIVGASPAGNDTITISGTYDGTNATVSFEGSTGQLFSVANSTAGSLFTVNDQSGFAALEVENDGTVILNQNSGNVLIGTTTDDGTNRLQVAGSMNVTGSIASSGGMDFADNIKVRFGTGNDLEIFHDGANSIIRTSPTGVGAVQIAGRDVAADGTKLDGIAANATNVTNNNQLTNGAGYTTCTGTTTPPEIPTNNNQLTNGAGYTTCTGTVTPGQLTFYPNSNPSQFTSVTNNNQLTNGAGYTTCTGTTVPNQIPTNNNQLTNGQGYTTCTGTTVPNQIPTNNNQLTNGQGYTTCTGTVTPGQLTFYPNSNPSGFTACFITNRQAGCYDLTDPALGKMFYSTPGTFCMASRRCIQGPSRCIYATSLIELSNGTCTFPGLSGNFDYGHVLVRTPYRTSPFPQMPNASSRFICFVAQSTFGIGAPPNGQVGCIALTSNSQVALLNISDYRRKCDVEDFPSQQGLEAIRNIRPRSFKWVGEDSDQPTSIGFIAHELGEYAPEAVVGTKDEVVTWEDIQNDPGIGEVGDPIFQSVDASKVVPKIIAAMKELDAKITAMESRVTALENA